MTTFVLLPGAWVGAWIWKPVSDELSVRGHTAYPVTLPGLDHDGDASGISLSTHVDYVLELLAARDLRDAVIVGHSYAGIVAGMVADRAPERVSHGVFVDSNLPIDKRSMLDGFSPEDRRYIETDIAENNGRLSPMSVDDFLSEGLTQEQARWVIDNGFGLPADCIREPASLKRPLSSQRGTYILCNKPGHPVGNEVTALLDEPKWTFPELATGHWPMVTAPDELTEILIAATSP